MFLVGTKLILCVVLAAGCAKANTASPDDSGGGNGGDASCGEQCDADMDHVVDLVDMCPNTPLGAVVNQVGCSDAQVNPTLQPFPAFGLTWVPSGDIGKAGGLTWMYTGIMRKDLFHITWIVCDDPGTPCGVSLDGPIDSPAENWTFSPTDSDFPNGKAVFTNTTRIRLFDTTTPILDGRLTITAFDPLDVPIAFAPVATLGVTPRLGTHGIEIIGTSFKILAIIEVKDATSAWTPYIDYYNAAPTPTAGGDTFVSFGGSFYGE